MSLDLAVERRRGRFAGSAALASVGCWLGALMLANAGGSGQTINLSAAQGQSLSVDRSAQLMSFYVALGDQRVAVVLRCAGLILSAAVAFYLYTLIDARRPRTSRAWLVGTAFGGAALVCVSTVEGYLALAHVATVFHDGRPRTEARAQRLMDGSAALQVAAVLDLVSRIVYALWIGVASLQMLRTRLLDSFLAYWGFGACGALVLLPVGDAMFIGWLGSVGILALGYWPGGRPAAWSREIEAST
jgi:hypothetical protein